MAIKHRHVTDKWIYVFVFKLSHKNICIRGCRDGSHCTYFDSEIIFAIENKVVQGKYEWQKCCDDFVATFLFSRLSSAPFVAAMPSDLWIFV